MRLPVIKKAGAYLQWAHGAKYLVGRGKQWDMCEDLPSAICYWLWWCGVPPRIAFMFFKKHNND